MPSSSALFAKVAAGLATLERDLMPAACLLCGAENSVRDGETLVCSLCRSRWHPVSHPVCARCGETRTPGEPACRICRWWPESLGRVRSAVWLSGGARQAVHLLKFEGWWRMAEPMARAMLAGDFYAVEAGCEAKVEQHEIVDSEAGRLPFNTDRYAPAFSLADPANQPVGRLPITNRLPGYRGSERTHPPQAINSLQQAGLTGSIFTRNQVQAG